MGFNYNKLRGVITEKCRTQTAFAQAMGRSHASISDKLNNKVQWTQAEIFKACEVLGIPENEITIYFFTPKEVI